MPVRFTSPSLGGQRESFLHKGEWQFGLAYRHLYADQWFVGTQVDETKTPGQQPLYVNINSLDVSLTYGVSDRASVTLTLPFLYGTQSRFYPDHRRHKVQSIGLGDVNLIANTWLWAPQQRPNGNLNLGLGIKTPLGSNKVMSDWWLADSSQIRHAVDQSIQLGDGGWGIIVQAQAFQRILPSTSLYFVGTYMLSTKEHTDVISPLEPIAPIPLGVPDVYYVRGGVAQSLWADEGLSASLGARLDGITRRDIIGGGDDYFRRPGYTLFLDPGLSLRRGSTEFTFNFPIRLHQNFPPSIIDRKVNFTGGGDLADYLIYAGYTHRF
jgi:hypothetical protein